MSIVTQGFGEKETKKLELMDKDKREIHVILNQNTVKIQMMNQLFLEIPETEKELFDSSSELLKKALKINELTDEFLAIIYRARQTREK